MGGARSGAPAYRAAHPDTTLAVPLPSPLPLTRARESRVSRRRPPSRPGARGRSPRPLAEAAQPLRLWRCRRRRANQTSHGPPPEAAGTGGRRAPACAPSFARDAVARSAPRDRRDREGDGWAELDRARPSIAAALSNTTFAVPLPCPLPLARARESRVSAQRPPSRPGARGQSPRPLAEAAEPIRLWTCRRRRGNQTSHGQPEKRRARGVDERPRARRRSRAMR